MYSLLKTGFTVCEINQHTSLICNEDRKIRVLINFLSIK